MRRAGLVCASCGWLGVGLGVLLAGQAGAQETAAQQAEVQAPGGARARGEKSYALPAPSEPGPTSAVVRGEMAPASPRGETAADAWTGARWLDLEGAEARLTLAGVEQRVQVGTTIGGDRVKNVRARQLVLERPARPGQPGGSALVIVDFVGEQPRVRVLWSQDPKATSPAEAR